MAASPTRPAAAAAAAAALSDFFNLNKPGSPTPGGGKQPGAFGPGQAAGLGAYTPEGNIPLYGGGSTVNGMVFSPPGQQAPADQFNVDVNPPYAAYPPGTRPPLTGRNSRAAP